MAGGSEDGDDHSDEGPNLWWVGVILCVTGSIMLNCGNNLQSLGLQGKPIKVDNPHEPEKEGSSPEDSRTEPNKAIWRVGTALFFTGSVFTFASFGFAPQSMVASLEAVQFVSNVIFGKCVLGAEVTKKVLCGSLLIVGGCILAVANSNSETHMYTVPQMMTFYNNPLYIGLLITAGSGAFVLRIVYKIYKKRKAQRRPLPGTSIMLPLTYAMFSAIFGTQAVVQAKCLSQVVFLTLEGNNQLKYWFTWVMLTIMLCFFAVWLIRMNSALGKFDPLFIIPVLQVFFIIFAIIAGGFFFGEFKMFAKPQYHWNLVGFIAGVGLVCVGLALLAPGPSDTEQNKPDSPKAKSHPNEGEADRDNSFLEDVGDNIKELGTLIKEIVEEDFAEVENAVGSIMKDPGAVVENLTTAANLNLVGAAQAHGINYGVGADDGGERDSFDLEMRRPDSLTTSDVEQLNNPQEVSQATDAPASPSGTQALTTVAPSAQL